MHSPTVGPDTPPRWRRPTQVAGAVLALIVAGLVGYALAPGSTAAPTPAATASPSVTADAGGGASGSADAGGGAAGPTVQQPAQPAPPAAPAPPARGVATFTDWRNGGGLNLVNGVTADIAAVTGASPASRQPICAALGKDVNAAKAYAPMPDAAAQSAWSTALTRAGSAGSACAANPAAAVTADLQAATTALDTATERMSYFSGH